MKKTTCVILGLAFLALGILGIAGLVPMFTTDTIYVNIGEIVLGAFGFVVGVYSPQSLANYRLRVETSQQGKEITQQAKEIDQQGKEINQQAKEIDLQRKEIDQQRLDINEQKNKS